MNAPRSAASNRRSVSDNENCSPFRSLELFTQDSFMPKSRNPKKPRSPSAVMSSKLRTYATAVGYVAFEWNQAQEALGVLFGKILQIPHPAAAATIWHSLPSDRAQRQALREIVDLYYRGDEQVFRLKLARDPDIKYLKLFADNIIWVVNQIDNKYSIGRNNAIHIPMAFLGHFENGIDWTEFVPDISFFNKRAVSVIKKDIIDDMKICSLNLNILWSYIKDLTLWFDARDFSMPLPKKPLLQELPRPTSPKP